MPIYYFNLKTQEGRVPDPDGIELFDDARAREYAGQVALELMHQRELKTRFWRMEVCNSDRRPVGELLFASIDPSVAHLSRTCRITVEQASARTAGLIDAILDTRRSYHELKATLSRSKGKPYLTTRDGIPVQDPVGRKGDSRIP
jgi:hypothetical protein